MLGKLLHYHARYRSLLMNDVMDRKSQIAIEYCYRYSEKYPDCTVFWVYGSTVERFEQAYENIARSLELPGWNDPKANTLQIVSDWLRNGDHKGWLMILDNADDEDVFLKTRKNISSEGAGTNQDNAPLSTYLPLTSRGSILVTSRNRMVAFKLTEKAEHIIDVSPMDEEEAITLLHKRLPDARSSDEVSIDLVETLERYPLAITQAAA